MLEKLVSFSIKNRRWVAAGAAILCAAGIYSALRLPIDAVPDITNVQVTVNTNTGALDPAQVETAVSYRIETELSGLPQVREVRSLSRFGLSQVVVVFQENVNIYWARQQVSERLQSVAEELPAGLQPRLGPVSTGLGEVFLYTLSARPGSALASRSEEERLLYLRTIQDYVLKPYLKARIPDVAEIDAIGGYSREIHVELDPPRMGALGVTLEEMVDRLATVGESVGGGYIERDRRQIVVRTRSAAPGLESLAALPVRLNVYGAPIRLRDVARVREGHRQRVGAATLNGQETVLATVMMLLGANSRQTALAARAALAAAPLPGDVIATEVYGRDFLVDSVIQTVLRNLAEGAALVIVTLLLILGNVRAALLVALAIPVSMLAAAVGMERFGVSANLMSLGAIDFGLLVDGAVVLIENLIRRMQHIDPRQLSFSEKMELLRSSAAEVVRPISFGLFVIMVVYAPILSLEGIEGKMFRPMALTVLMALGASLAVALLLMPALAMIFLMSKPPAHKTPVAFVWLQRLYQPMLDFALRRTKLLAALAAIVTVVSLMLFQHLGANFIPQLGEGDLLVSFVRDPSMSLTASIEEQKRAEQILLKFGEVERASARIGTAESASDPMGVYMADTLLILKKDREQWPLVDGHRRSVAELREAIRASMEKEFPAAEISLSQPIEFRFNEILEGSRADVNLRIFGADLEQLYALQGRAATLLESMPGAESVELDAITALRKGPALNINLDYQRLAASGISLADANFALETAMSGRRVGSYFEQDRRFPIVLRLPEGHRNDPGRIGAIPVGLGDGGAMPISTVSRLEQKEEIINIARNGARRYAAVAIDLSDADTLGFVERARQAVDSQLHLPEGYYAEWGGQFLNLQSARTRLLIVTPLVLAVIFLTLMRSFGSLRQTLLVFVSIPFAASGGVLALALRGIPFSVSASVGFIALSGIAILNAMVMVSFINQLRAEGRSLYDAAREGAMIRLRPVSMTAMVASLGFLPMAINTGLGAEVQRPLATVVIGGLITATTLTLLLLPGLYILLERRWSDGRSVATESG
ncbi:MAG: CusA/CzcA family heavy metal efflux RND transporter [Leptospirales bacterium]|nr:CusA/CzcA family heavy metal efflux RND transporter [Leptospirales bacterium]